MKRFLTASKISVALYSLCFSVALFLGLHIQTDNLQEDIDYRSLWAGRGPGTRIYFRPFTLNDVFVFALMFCVVLALLACVLKLASVLGKRHSRDYPPPSSMRFRHIAAVALLLMACWLPWFLHAYPGVVYIDTLQYIECGLDTSQLLNDHPFIWCRFIAGFYSLGAVIGHSNWGLALYTLVQMSTISLLLAYEICWIVARCKLHYTWAILFAFFFGLSDMFSIYAVSIWKDPPFAIWFVFLTLFCLDLALDKDEDSPAFSPIKQVLLVVSLFAISFIRHNGVVTVVAMVVAFAIYAHKLGIRLLDFKPCKLSAISLALILVIQGPVYAVLKVESPMFELYGPLLNQIARVCFVEGDIPEADRAYLETFTSIDVLKENYHPRTSDLVKFFLDVDWTQVGPEFLLHWASIGLHNPRSFIAAQCLQTYGHWAPWVEDIYYWDYTVEVGYPFSVAPSLFDYDTGMANLFKELGICPKDWLRPRVVREVAGADAWTGWRQISGINAAHVLWFALLCVPVLKFTKHDKLILALVPCLSNIVPVALFTGVWYLPRYALSAMYCIPLFVFILIYAFTANDEAASEGRGAHLKG